MDNGINPGQGSGAFVTDAFDLGVDAEANTQVTEAIRNFFGRTVKVNTGKPASNAEQLSEMTKGEYSKKSLLRMASRLITFGFSTSTARPSASGQGKDESWEFLDTQTGCDKSGGDDWEHVPETLSCDIDAIVLEAGGNNRLVIPDSELVQALGSLSFSSTAGNLETLYASEGLTLGDICQNDARNTCHIHSVAAAYLASPKSASVLTGMFREIEGEYVSVTLVDPVIGDVDIVVNKSRILSGNKDLYSYSSKGHGWPAILEKATQGLNLAFKQLYIEEKAKNGHESKFINDLRGELTHALDRNDDARLDYADLLLAMGRFPATDFDIESPASEPSLIIFDHIGLSDSSQSSKKEHLEVCLGLGVPVVVGTRKLENEQSLKGKIKVGWSTLTSGSPTGHAMAVLKAHTVVIQGKQIEGILVFDPAGEKKSPVMELDTYYKDGFVPQINEAVQFVSWDEVPQRFDRAVIAKGAPVFKNQQMPVNGDAV
nr:hypothetical protein [Endozoicomonas sp.]